MKKILIIICTILLLTGCDYLNSNNNKMYNATKMVIQNTDGNKTITDKKQIKQFVDIILNSKEVEGFVNLNDSTKTVELHDKSDNIIELIKVWDDGYAGLINKELKIEEKDLTNFKELISVKKATINNINGKEFIRTYTIYNIADSNDYKYIYITIRGFQQEEIETVKIERDKIKNPKTDQSYEFKFKINNNKIEDNIKSIFNNSEIISINSTDKTGLEQVNEEFK